jgi:hypothetical protein
MAQTTLVVVWAVCFAFVRWRWFWGRWCACVDGGGGRMGWELWELFVVVGVIWQWCHFSFFQEHMTTWSVHGHRVYKYPPNNYPDSSHCV